MVCVFRVLSKKIKKLVDDELTMRKTISLSLISKGAMHYSNPHAFSFSPKYVPTLIHLGFLPPNSTKWENTFDVSIVYKEGSYERFANEAATVQIPIEKLTKNMKVAYVLRYENVSKSSWPCHGQKYYWSEDRLLNIQNPNSTFTELPIRCFSTKTGWSFRYSATSPLNSPGKVEFVWYGFIDGHQVHQFQRAPWKNYFGQLQAEGKIIPTYVNYDRDSWEKISDLVSLPVYVRVPEGMLVVYRVGYSHNGIQKESEICLVDGHSTEESY